MLFSRRDGCQESSKGGPRALKRKGAATPVKRRRAFARSVSRALYLLAAFLEDFLPPCCVLCVPGCVVTCPS